ncbi:MAG: hypothetical protein CSB06_00120 [Bacteroidia bacterium]|nr:MAG: hypothetical protein CSB06_00120 [Bacteroidia bacterium]
MKKQIVIVIAGIACFFTACKKTEPVQTTQVNIELQKPEALEGKDISMQARIVLKNINSGDEVVMESSDWTVSGIEVEEGLYNARASVSITHNDLKKSEAPIVSQWEGFSENITVKEEPMTLSVPLVIKNEQAGKNFVISEIYITWSLYPGTNKKYMSDSFFEIYNNSDQTLYADGLCIGESAIKTAHILENFSPDIRGEAVPIRIAYRIPGSGTDYPVAPGETFVFCDVAINHKEKNENSVDLSQADFEWYDNDKRDTDIPEVPNMEQLVKHTSAKVWKPFSRGQHSYILFRVPNTTTADDFLASHSFDYTFTFKGEVKERHVSKVSNAEVIDAVECSTPSAFEWKALSPSLDLMWTHCGDNDDSRFSHSMKRKIEKTKEGRILLQDTNNSEEDFIATAANPSPGTVEDHQQ